MTADSPSGSLLSKLARPPIPAILALLIVFVYQGLGHTIMIVMEHQMADFLYTASMIGGLLGAMIVWYGRDKSDNMATIMGFIGGNLIWLCWIEFSFHYYARHLGIDPLVENGMIVTKQEYLVMEASVGVLLASLAYFFMRDTNCNAFVWLQKLLRMNMVEKSNTRGRNVAAIVAVETIYVTWFCYVLLLVLYNPEIAGDRSIWAWLIMFGCLVWGLYLFTHLIRFKRMAPALRYAIPTAIIFWNSVEILGRWNLFTEFWEHPERFGMEMSVIAAGIVSALLLAYFLPGKPSQYT